MTRDDVVNAGKLIYGRDRFQAEMARDIGATPDTVGRNVDGDGPVFANFKRRLLALMRAKVSELRHRASEIERLVDEWTED